MEDVIINCRCGNKPILEKISTFWRVFCRTCGGMGATYPYKHAYQAINTWNSLRGGGNVSKD